MVSTSTASGKSLCYNIPVIEALAADRGSTAIYIFPTKALAQDQMRALRAFLGAAFPEETPMADVYDGDTPKVKITHSALIIEELPLKLQNTPSEPQSLQYEG